MFKEMPDKRNPGGCCATPEPPVGQAAASHPASLHGPALAALCADELRERHPRIQAAGSADDLKALKTEAHALRGVAANFGLDVLADELLALEVAARSEDRDRLAGVLRRLPAEVAQALAALGHAGE
jgi:HPt (histidine-containing phosphotransfer) domain-containing protein